MIFVAMKISAHDFIKVSRAHPLHNFVACTNESKFEVRTGRVFVTSCKLTAINSQMQGNVLRPLSHHTYPHTSLMVSRDAFPTCQGEFLICGAISHIMSSISTETLLTDFILFLQKMIFWSVSVRVHPEENVFLVILI